VEEVAGVGVATSAGIKEEHDIPLDVLTSVTYWLVKGGYPPMDVLNELRGTALKGGKHCFNEGCEVVGHLKEFKVCPQCKTARYCGAACQKADWTTGRGLHPSTFRLNAITFCGIRWVRDFTQVY
jgi:hypothetical protein